MTPNRNEVFLFFITRIKKLTQFLGKRLCWMLIISTIVGCLLFVTESSFVVILQLFLFSLGLITRDQLLIPDWVPTTQGFAVGIFFLFGLCRGLIQMIKSYLTGVIGQEFIKQQRARTIEYGLTFANSVSTSQIITLCTERVSQGGAFLQNFGNLILVLTASCLFFISGLRLAPYEMIIGVTVLGVFLFPLKYFSKNINNAGEGVRDEWNFVNATLISGLKNNFFLRVYDVVDLEIEKSIQSLESYLRHYRRYFLISAFKNSLPPILGVFVVCIITFVSIKYIHTKAILLVAFFYIFMKLAQSMSEVSVGLTECALNKRNFLELYEMYLLHKDYKQKISSKLDCPEHFNASVSAIEIKVENLSFSRDGKTYLFNDLSFQVGTGGVLLIKGPSGVGKSTLLMLILGLIKSTGGTVSINGIKVDEFDGSISQHVGYVGPDPYLIIGTLKDNLLFGNLRSKEVGDSELLRALEFVCLDPVAFPLNLQISEHAALSTGQKQRISIARAILRKPKLLILDEATANLDRDTEEYILKNLKPLIPTITTVVVSHKSSFDNIATAVLNLEKIQNV